MMKQLTVNVFPTYENLSKLDKNIKFLTIRRRGEKIVDNLNKKPASAWKKVRVPMADGKGRTLKVIDENIFLKDYGGELRQIAITGHEKIKPALLILKKKRNLPSLLTAMEPFRNKSFSTLGNRKLIFTGDTSS